MPSVTHFPCGKVRPAGSVLGAQSVGVSHAGFYKRHNPHISSCITLQNPKRPGTWPIQSHAIRSPASRIIKSERPISRRE